MRMKIGYARVSTQEQNTELQFDALKAVGCERIFDDQVSGSKTDRPGLAAALTYVRPGDSLVVWRLDRLGRNLKHLIEVVEDLESRGVGFITLQEGFDTSTTGGKMVFQIFEMNLSSIKKWFIIKIRSETIKFTYLYDFHFIIL